MTLVVGKIAQGGIRIDSDSKITDPTIASNRNNIFSGLLKTIILNPNLTISYAGGVETAQKAIERIYELKRFEINTIKKELLKINIESDYETDFLIGSLENQPLLYKIANGKIEITNTTFWIGDKDGFNLFQKEFHSNLKNSEPGHIFSVHSTAFEKVIKSDKIESIGGFHITVHRTKLGFEYMFKMELNMGQPTTMTVKNGSTIIPWGNATTGSFSSSYLKSDNPLNPAIGIHFPMGNFGTLYYPKKSREIVLIKNVNAFEFVDKIKSDFKIKLTGVIKNGEMITRI